MIWRVKLERKHTLNKNEAGRIKYNYVEAISADSAKKTAGSFPENKAFIATEARRA